LTGISLLNPPLPSAPARFVEAGVEIVETAGFGPGFANPALVGYPERLRQVQAAGVFGS
jgi:hypothetical protein